MICFQQVIAYNIVCPNIHNDRVVTFVWDVSSHFVKNYPVFGTSISCTLIHFFAVLLPILIFSCSSTVWFLSFSCIVFSPISTTSAYPLYFHFFHYFLNICRSPTWLLFLVCGPISTFLPALVDKGI